MGSCSSNLFFSFILLFFLFHHSFSLNIVEKTCKKSSQTDPNLSYNFCLTSLQVVPNIRSANLNQLGLVSINLAITNATHTNSYIKSLLKHKGLNSFYKNCLKDCFELYSDAIYSLKVAMKDLGESKSYKVANIEVSSAMDDSTTCEEGFLEKKGVVSPLTKRNADLFRLGAIALSITNMLS